MQIQTFDNFRWGLNLKTSTQIDDNQFTICNNYFYNNEKQLQTRRGFTTFGDSVGSKPITSYFFYKRDDNLESVAVCHAGNSAYEYDGTNWNSIKTWLSEYETIPWRTNRRTRRDYAVYKNVIYMGNWVDPYAKYDGSTYSEIWLNAAQTCTFNNATNQVSATTHWLSTWDEVKLVTSGWTFPAELNENEVYYVIGVDANNFQLTNVPHGSAISFTDNGTGTLQYRALTEPRCKYIEYLSDTLFGSGDYGNPNTLYYTNTAPSNWDDLNANVVVVGWDETGKITGMTELQQTVVTFKTNKIYSVNISTPSASPIDAQWWWYANRSIWSVNNSKVYLTSRGVDTLKARSGIGGANALSTDSLSENVRKLYSMIEEKQYEASCGLYIPEMNNYYIAIDTDDDNRPDTVLVYSSLTKWWTTYTLPSLYTFGRYINSDEEVLYLFASASGGQMYQFEKWFDDDDTPIETELQTKEFDFSDPLQQKVFSFVDITWLKQEWWTIDVRILVEWEEESFAQITDDNISLDEPVGSLWVWAIGLEPLGIESWDFESWLPMYRYKIRVPMYVRGDSIAVNMRASWVQHTLDKIKMWVNAETFTVFGYGNIG